MTTSKLITKRDLRKVFFRSFPMEWTWNYEKQQNLGYTYAMIPIIEKLYKDKPEEKAAAPQEAARGIGSSDLPHFSSRKRREGLVALPEYYHICVHDVNICIQYSFFHLIH